MGSGEQRRAMTWGSQSSNLTYVYLGVPKKPVDMGRHDENYSNVMKTINSQIQEV